MEMESRMLAVGGGECDDLSFNGYSFADKRVVDLGSCVDLHNNVNVLKDTNCAFKYVKVINSIMYFTEF